jgi:hypothetical protein
MKIGIVLGYGLFEETNQEYKDYLNWISKEIGDNQIEKVILCGGTTNQNKPGVSEAQTIHEYLSQIKPGFNNFVLEDHSLTTNQNLENAAKELQQEDQIFVWCDLIRLAKVIWLSLFFLLKIDRPSINRAIFEFIKERKIKPFVYKNLVIKGFDFPSRDKYLATAQSFSTLLEIEAIFDPELDELILNQRKKDFGLVR